jgi:hypothetical protein
VGAATRALSSVLYSAVNTCGTSQQSAVQ